MEEINDKYSTEEFPEIRRATIDLLKAAKRKNIIHGMVEIDISKARSDIYELKKNRQHPPSLTAFIISCVAKAVESNRRVHAYRNWKNQLVLFDDVDISTTIERKLKGNSEVIPKIIRSANQKSVAGITKEIKKGKFENVQQSEVYGLIKLYLAIPPFIRQTVFRILDRFPVLMKKKAGTVMVTSVGMMLGKGAGWGMPIASHTLNVTIGGVVERPVVVDRVIEIREHICLTVSVDHSIVDGAPIARFVRLLKSLVSNGITSLNEENSIT